MQEDFPLSESEKYLRERASITNYMNVWDAIPGIVDFDKDEPGYLNQIIKVPRYQEFLEREGIFPRPLTEKDQEIIRQLDQLADEFNAVFDELIERDDKAKILEYVARANSLVTRQSVRDVLK